MQEEDKMIRAEARLAHDVYLTLNAQGREFFMAALAQINQDCFRRSPEEIGVAQSVAEFRPAVKALSGVESVPSEALRRINRELRLSRGVIDTPDGLRQHFLQGCFEAQSCERIRAFG